MEFMCFKVVTNVDWFINCLLANYILAEAYSWARYANGCIGAAEKATGRIALTVRTAGFLNRSLPKLVPWLNPTPARALSGARRNCTL